VLSRLIQRWPALQQTRLARALAACAARATRGCLAPGRIKPFRALVTRSGVGREPKYSYPSRCSGARRKLGNRVETKMSAQKPDDTVGGTKGRLHYIFHMFPNDEKGLSFETTNGCTARVPSSRCMNAPEKGFCKTRLLTVLPSVTRPKLNQGQ